MTGVVKQCYISMRRFFTVLIVTFSMVTLAGQIALPGKPYPLWYNGAPDIVAEIVELPVTAKEQKLPEDSGMLKPAGEYSVVDLCVKPSTHGTWDTLADGTRIWRYAIVAETADIVSVVFAPYTISKGVKVFIYDANQQYVKGAFTDLNNKPVNMLATSFIPGYTIVVEMQVPHFIDSFGDLGISGLGYDRNESMLKTAMDPWFGLAGRCNIDVICKQYAPVTTVKNAVVRIVFNGSQRCTGTLVNTAEKNGSNFILTAAHCFTRTVDNIASPAETSANSAVFYFSHESSGCNRMDYGEHKSLSGATIRAWSDKYDFALLELLEPVPYHYRPYYAGWDHTGRIPESVFTIHHPWGDVKKISVDQHAPTIASYKNDAKTNLTGNAHWLVSRWEEGTTESGSSGAPLFDMNGRVRGTLTGGLANCVYPINDYFQMFSRSWRSDMIPEHELVEWLDPYQKSPGYFDGYDPYAAWWQSGDTLSNIKQSEAQVVETEGLEWGSYSGHNNEYMYAFSEKFTTDTPKVLFGVLLNVAQNKPADLRSQLILQVHDGINYPEVLVHEQKVYLGDLAPGINMIKLDSAVTCERTFFAGYRIHYDAEPDTFSVYMACTAEDDTVNSAFVFDGIEWKSLSDYSDGMFNTSFAVFPLVHDSKPEVQEKPELDSHVKLYPNPAKHIIQVIFDDFTNDPVQLHIADTQGRIVYERKFGKWQHIIPINLMNFSAGLYIININEGGKITQHKFIVAK